MRKMRMLSFITALIIACLPLGLAALGEGTLSNDGRPGARPTAKPTDAPAAAPTAAPTAAPAADPTAAPGADPTVVPAVDPTAVPDPDPVEESAAATEVPVDGTISLGGKIEISVTAKKSTILRLKVKNACDATLDISGVPVQVEVKNEKTGDSFRKESSDKGVLKISRHWDKGDYLLIITIQKGRRAGNVTVKAIKDEQPAQPEAGKEVPTADPVQEDETAAVPDEKEAAQETTDNIPKSEYDGKQDSGKVDKNTQIPVSVTSSFTGIIREGDPVTLTAEAEGTEKAVFTWECDKGDGFSVVEGVSGNTLTYEATLESLLWVWRVTVSVN